MQQRDLGQVRSGRKTPDNLRVVRRSSPPFAVLDYVADGRPCAGGARLLNWATLT